MRSRCPQPGDWVIVGPDDDVYTCDAKVFSQTYERVEGPVPNLYKKVHSRARRAHTFLRIPRAWVHGSAG